MFWQKNTNAISINNNTQEIKNTNEKALASSNMEFKIAIRQSANLEIDNGNGYGIAKIHKLEDMI